MEFLSSLLTGSDVKANLISGDNRLSRTHSDASLLKHPPRKKKPLSWIVISRRSTRRDRTGHFSAIVALMPTAACTFGMVNNDEIRTARRLRHRRCDTAGNNLSPAAS